MQQEQLGKPITKIVKQKQLADDLAKAETPVKKKRGFQPGNTYGRGRPPVDPLLKKQCQNLTSECVKRLTALMRNEEAKDGDRLNAIKLVLAYGHGQPVTPVDVKATHDVTAEFLEALKEVNAKGQQQQQARLINGASIDAEVTDVKPKRKGRVRTKAMDLIAGTGKAE